MNVTTGLGANARYGREPPKQAKLAVGSSNWCWPLKIMSWNRRFSLLQRRSHWRTMHFLSSPYECDSQDWPVIFGHSEVGHPQIVPDLDKGVLLANLGQFVTYIGRIYGLMKHFKENGVVV